MYRISSFSFRGNYSFLNFEILGNLIKGRNMSIFYLINGIFAAETIQGWNYMRKYGMCSFESFANYHKKIHYYNRIVKVVVLHLMLV